MKTICAWCKKLMAGDESDDGKVTHGICRECEEKLSNDHL